jgi:hypothetical protein
LRRRGPSGRDPGGASGAGADRLPRPLEGGEEPARAERLEQVVDGLELERRDRVVIEGGREDDGGDDLELSQSRHDLDARGLRHLDVQEDHVGAEAPDRLDRGWPVMRLAGLHALMRQARLCVPRRSTGTRIGFRVVTRTGWTPLISPERRPVVTSR